MKWPIDSNDLIVKEANLKCIRGESKKKEKRSCEKDCRKVVTTEKQIPNATNSKYENVSIGIHIRDEFIIPAI